MKKKVIIGLPINGLRTPPVVGQAADIQSSCNDDPIKSICWYRKSYLYLREP